MEVQVAICILTRILGRVTGLCDGSICRFTLIYFCIWPHLMLLPYIKAHIRLEYVCFLKKSGIKYWVKLTALA